MSTAIKQWYATLLVLPTRIGVETTGCDFAWCAKLSRSISYENLFDTEKQAIDAARTFRVDEITRLQEEVDSLDTRYDQLEDEEAGGAK